jgi:DNA polymerase-1
MDYNAAEVRVWAHYINDKNLIDAFKKDLDIYKYMAQKIFGVPIDQVTHDQRQQMKGVVLGLMYGRGVWSIADEFKMSVEDAQLIVNSFFQQFPNALRWMNLTKKFLKEKGYVRSLFGRKRRLLGVNSFNEQIREEAYRQSINFPIQSSTSDLNFLVGMRTMEQSKKQNLKVKAILAVHDSLLFEADEKDVDPFIKIINEQIEKIPLRVPLKNDIKVSECWSKT